MTLKREFVMVTARSRAAFENVKWAMQGATKHITTFRRVYRDFAFQHYMIYHDRLPGSDRTTRLRKKRLTVVLKWYGKQLSENMHPAQRKFFNDNS